MVWVEEPFCCIRCGWAEYSVVCLSHLPHRCVQIQCSVLPILRRIIRTKDSIASVKRHWTNPVKWIRRMCNRKQEAKQTIAVETKFPAQISEANRQTLHAIHPNGHTVVCLYTLMALVVWLSVCVHTQLRIIYSLLVFMNVDGTKCGAGFTSQPIIGLQSYRGVSLHSHIIVNIIGSFCTNGSSKQDYYNKPITKCGVESVAYMCPHWSESLENAFHLCFCTISWYFYPCFYRTDSILAKRFAYAIVFSTYYGDGFARRRFMSWFETISRVSTKWCPSSKRTRDVKESTTATK